MCTVYNVHFQYLCGYVEHEWAGPPPAPVRVSAAGQPAVRPRHPGGRHAGDIPGENRVGGKPVEHTL